jgi:transcriptional regulator with GAF, ATPase, and Fis domain
MSSPAKVIEVAADPSPRLVVIHGSRVPNRATVRLDRGRRVVLDAEVSIDWNAQAGHFELSAMAMAVRVNGADVSYARLADGDVIRCSDTIFVYSECDPFAEVRRRAEIIAPSPLSLLVLGETGSGKEVLARAVHAASGRPGPFVSVNCAAIPRDLFATELFGHVRGAFSGAVQGRKGWIAASDGGTLLLDEIGDMPPELQPGLLRALEAKVVAPLGADHEVPVDLRVIAATNRDLQGAVAAGSFRSDLFARLAQFIIKVPPLRQRRTEILPLAMEFAAEIGFPLHLDASAAEALMLYHWPFNVRELRSTIGALGLFARDAPRASLLHIHEAHPAILSRAREGAVPAGAPANGPDTAQAARRVRRSSANVLHDQIVLTEHLAEAEGNVAALARRLGTSRSHVYRWLRRWGLTRT